MNRKEEIQITAECLQSGAYRQARYSLLRLWVEDTAVYALCARDGDGRKLEILGENDTEAREAFSLVTEGGLSPRHLFDWVTDWRRAREWETKSPISFGKNTGKF